MPVVVPLPGFQDHPGHRSLALAGGRVARAGGQVDRGIGDRLGLLDGVLLLRAGGGRLGYGHPRGPGRRIEELVAVGDEVGDEVGAGDLGGPTRRNLLFLAVLVRGRYGLRLRGRRDHGLGLLRLLGGGVRGLSRGGRGRLSHRLGLLRLLGGGLLGGGLLGDRLLGDRLLGDRLLGDRLLGRGLRGLRLSGRVSLGGGLLGALGGNLLGRGLLIVGALLVLGVLHVGQCEISIG